MKKARLLKLASLLEADANNKKGIRFDMGDFGTVEDPTKPISCGTSACAMGLAGLSGAFKRAGLEVKIFPNGNVGFKWKRRNIDGFLAAKRLFGIELWQAHSLFSPNGNDTGAIAERAKAKEIREFVRIGDL